MSEVTPAELAEWLAELPEEVRLDLRLSVDGRWFEHSVYLTNHHHALALWFTAATLWLWGREEHIEPPMIGYGWWLTDRPLIDKESSPYHALAAAVRRVRAEEGGD